MLTSVELTEVGLLELQVVTDPPVDAPLWRRPDAVPAAWRPDLCREEFAVAGPGLDGAFAFDDGADPDACRVLAPGDWVGQDFGSRQRVTDLTLTTLDAVPSDAFMVEHSDDGLNWQEAPTTHREPLPANRTTPFQLANRIGAGHWRVRAMAAVRLRQLELFDLGPG